MINVTPDSTGVLVKADVAAKQMEAEKPTAEPTAAKPGQGTPGATPGLPPTPTGQGTPPPSPPVLKRFHATVTLDSSRIGRDAGRIAEEVVQHLALLPGAKVEVVLDIQAELPEGAPENVVRTVTENCRTLKFSSQGFENE